MRVKRRSGFRAATVRERFRAGGAQRRKPLPYGRGSDSFDRPLWGFLCVAAIGVLVGFGCEERSVKVEDRPVEVISERPGAGSFARDGDLVTIDYKAAMKNGRVLQQMRDYRFVIGSGAVIMAIDEGVRGMREGGTRTISAPPHKHWGRAGHGTGPDAIPPNTWLNFEIKLTNVE